MSPDFIEDLQSQIAEFEQAATHQNEHTQSRVSATAELDDTIDEGLKLRRQLNAVVRITARNDPGLLAAWESASHIERKSSRAAESSKPASPALILNYRFCWRRLRGTRPEAVRCSDCESCP